MQFKAKSCESFPNRPYYALCFFRMLYHTDEIVCITHHKTRSPDPWFYFLFKPKVKHIVQEYVRDDGAKIPALGCPLLGQHQLSRVHISGLQEPPDQQQEAWVLDADFKTAKHPRMRAVVKESLDICFYQSDADAVYQARVIRRSIVAG
jgi:hypothetical protein